MNKGPRFRQPMPLQPRWAVAVDIIVPLALIVGLIAVVVYFFA